MLIKCRNCSVLWFFNVFLMFFEVNELLLIWSSLRLGSFVIEFNLILFRLFWGMLRILRLFWFVIMFVVELEILVCCNWRCCRFGKLVRFLILVFVGEFWLSIKVESLLSFESWFVLLLLIGVFCIVMCEVLFECILVICLLRVGECDLVGLGDKFLWWFFWLVEFFVLVFLLVVWFIVLWLGWFLFLVVE